MMAGTDELEEYKSYIEESGIGKKHKENLRKLIQSDKYALDNLLSLGAGLKEILNIYVRDKSNVISIFSSDGVMEILNYEEIDYKELIKIYKNNKELYYDMMGKGYSDVLDVGPREYIYAYYKKAQKQIKAEEKSWGFSYSDAADMSSARIIQDGRPFTSEESEDYLMGDVSDQEF